MKLTYLLFAFLPLCLQAQTEVFGFSANIENTKFYQKKITQWKQLGYTGISFNVPWCKDQSSANDYSHAFVKEGVLLLCDSGLDVMLQLWKGDNAFNNGTTSTLWLHYAGVDTFNTDGGAAGRFGPWPDYYAGNYVKYANKYDSTLIDTLKSLSDRFASVKKHLKYIFPSYGSTGDLGAIKGIPFNSRFNHYVTPDQVWKDYTVAMGDVIARCIKRTGLDVQFAINPANDGSMLSEYANTYPDAALKHWDAVNQYPIDGETFKLNWPRATWFTEVDETVRESPYPSDRFEAVRAGIFMKLGLFRFMNSWDTDPNAGEYIRFIQKYNDQYTPALASRGFCVLAAKVDILDSIHYPVNIYGQVFDNNAQYWSARKQIEKTTPDTFYRQQRLVRLAINRRNQARITEITKRTGAQFLVDAWTPKPPGWYYNNDISWYISENYDLNIKQVKPHETSTGKYRIDNGSIYGRATRTPVSFEGRQALYFDIDDRMITTNNRDIIRVVVTYKDTGTAKWFIRCYNNNRANITNTNSGQWRTATMQAPRFVKGNHLKYGSDFEIVVTNSKPLFVDMVEVENVTRTGGGSGAELQEQIDELRAAIEGLHTAIVILFVLVFLFGCFALILIIWRRRH
jgi:hypothetical protein